METEKNLSNEEQIREVYSLQEAREASELGKIFVVGGPMEIYTINGQKMSLEAGKFIVSRGFHSPIGRGEILPTAVTENIYDSADEAKDAIERINTVETDGN